MKKLLFFWDELKSTFWFIPVLILSASILLALGFVYLDTRIELSRTGMWRYLLVGSAASARSILTTIAGAMIGVAGTVFSITLVALTLASSQFGSRLIRNFMYDRLNQIVLGSYLSIFIYCLLVLNTITGIGEETFVPSLSILVALLAAVANIILLIVFIHHIAVSIQADKVISDISTSLSAHIEAQFSEKMDEDEGPQTDRDLHAIRSAFPSRQVVYVPKNGYLQYLDLDGLTNWAADKDSLVELHFRAGEFLVKGAELGVVYSRQKLEEAVLNTLHPHFVIGATRTHQQDAEHSIHQMVEIAARALSPGINDPYTAIACIDNLTSVLSYLSTVKFPSRFRVDSDGTLRLIVDVLTFEGMLDAAFNQIRQYATGTPSVVIRLMESLILLDKMARRKAQKTAIQKHVRMVMNMAKNTFEEPNDIKDLQERSKHIGD